MGCPEIDIALITAGDVQLLPKMLDAAKRYEERPSDAEKAALTKFAVQTIFF